MLHDIDAYPVPAGVSADRWTMLTTELKKQLIARSKDGKTLSVAPSGSDNALKDLKVTLNGSQATLTWTERNVGDYALDAEVGIADLAPLAAHYGETVTYGADGMPTPGVTNEQRGAVDGDGSGEIGISDLGPVAAHYGETLIGYNLYRGTTKLGGNPSISRGAPVSQCAPKYQYVDSGSGTNVTYYVRPVGSGGVEGVSTSVNTSGGTGQREWTIMFYYAGNQDGAPPDHSANLSSAMFDELNQIESDLPVTSQVAVVAEAKLRHDPTYPGTPPSDIAFRYLVQHDTNTGALNFGAGSHYQDLGFSSFDSSLSANITSFVQWAVATFPANHYALVIESHGSSWHPGKTLSGIIEDDSFKYVMDNSEVANAIQSSGVHIDLLDLDACLMGTVEVADEFESACDYLVFSENSLLGGSWLGLEELLTTPSMTPQQVAQACVNDYYNYWSSPPLQQEALTLSAVKTASVPALVTSIGALRNAIMANIISEQANLRNAAAASHVMGSGTDGYLAGQIDLYDFLEAYKARTSNSSILSAISTVESTLSAAVPSQYHTNVPGTSETPFSEGGMVLYMPTTWDGAYSVDSGAYSSWGSHYQTLPFNQTTHWYDVAKGVWNDNRFHVDLTWTHSAFDSGSNLNLWIIEPGGNAVSTTVGVPLQGTFSPDSSQSDVADEWYQSNSEPASGVYEIWVKYYKDNVWSISADASVTLTGWFPEQSAGPQYMDMSSPVDPTNGAGWWYAGSVTVP